MLKFVTIVLIIMSVCACAAIREHSGEYIGVSYRDAVTANGKPDSEHSFIFRQSDRLHEYQGNLYETLKDQDSIKLIEVWWEAENETTIIWFKILEDRLTAVDSLRYGKYVSI